MDAATRGAVAALWSAIRRIASGGTVPTGAAGGVLSGTYPAPGFAVDMATQAELNTHAGLTTGVHGLDAKADLVSSRVPTAELGSGVADNTKFLRGDQTWQVPPGGGGAAESFVSKSKWLVD